MARSAYFMLLVAASMAAPAMAAEPDLITTQGWTQLCNEKFCTIYQSYPDTIKNVRDRDLKNPAIAVAVSRENPADAMISMLLPMDVDRAKGVSFLPIERNDPRKWDPAEGFKAPLSGCDPFQCYVNPDEKSQVVLAHFFQIEGALYFTFTQKDKVYNIKADLSGFTKSFEAMQAVFQKK